MSAPGSESEPSGTLRIALHSGLCVRYDAISNSLMLKLALLERWRVAGASVEGTVFVQHSDYRDPRLIQVSGVKELICRQEFRSADVHIFEFGVAYAGFDSVFLLSGRVPTLGVYHNVTPVELFEDHSLRAEIDRSLIQRHNLSALTHVACDSEYSLGQLIEFGIPADRLSVLPLPPAVTAATERSAGQVEELVHLLYVGRLVRAKGIPDLLAAASILDAALPGRFRLTMCGNPLFSSLELIDEVERWCAGRPWAHLALSPSDEELARIYGQADVLVMPSYHEGYCVPVIEALAAGCRVVAYDSSNLPFILNGLGRLVPTGQVEELARALAGQIEELAAGAAVVSTERGALPAGEWRQQVADHLARHDESTFARRFAALLCRLVPGAERALAPHGELVG